MSKEIPSSPSAKPVDFEHLISEYIARFPKEMEILEIGGVFPGKKAEPIENPYTGETETLYFGNTGEHCVAVARCSEILAGKILGVDNPQTKKIVARALVHDSAKRYEILRSKALKEGKIDDAYSPSAYETIRPILKNEGVPQDIIESMVHAGQETGHNSFASFVESKDGKTALKTDNNLAEMIVHLADDMTYSPIVEEGEKVETLFLTTEERMKASNFPERYPFLYKEGFGFDQNGNVVFIKDIAEKYSDLIDVRTYADWQVWLAEQISAHLVSLMPVSERVENPQKYLKQLVNGNLIS